MERNTRILAKTISKCQFKERYISYLDSYKGMVDRIGEDRKHWNRFQNTDMMQSLYFVVASIEKAIACYDNSNCKFTKKEIGQLFNEMNIIAEKWII